MSQPLPRPLLDHLSQPGLDSWEGYRKAGGGKALEKALTGSTPEGVRADILASGLRGRGGSAFPTGEKLEAVARAGGPPRYVLMNGEEGGPGGFKDRYLLEGSPFLILEGLLLAGFASEAGHGICVIRRSAPEALGRFRRSVEQLRAAGWLGADIMGSGFSFDLTVEIGAGVFCCGEETALLESVQGRRGHPHPRPPYPSEQGFQGCPTFVANVETLANLPLIVDRGPEWFRGIGLADEPGTRLFGVSGHVKVPGVYEVPTGTPVGDVLALAGGPRDGERFAAVLPGGAVSAFLPADALDTPLAADSLAARGSCLGSGAIIAFSDRCCFVQVAQRLAAFFEQESCGKCTPCREGTKKLREMLESVSSAKRKNGSEPRRGAGKEVPPPRPAAILPLLIETLARTSACGLGRAVGTAIGSALTLFPDEFAAHFQRHECPKHVCWS